MKKKTLATASLLLALLMPLGATPLAVYADEVQTGISDVSEDPKGTGETNKDPEGTDETNKDPEGTGETNKDPEGTGETNKAPEGTGETNKAPEGTGETNKAPEGTGETNKAPEGTGKTNEAPEGTGKTNEAPEGTGETNTAKTFNATPTLNVGQIHVTNSNENFDKTYTDLGEAVKAAPSGSTIELSAGTYSLYSYSADPAALHDSSKSSTNPEWKQYIAGKSLTFVGQSTDDTFWNIGTPYYDAAGEKNGDYSFDGANVITFKNLTLRSPVQYDGTVLSSQKNYTGFIRPNETIVEDCVINGRTAYWGYVSAKFIRTTFKCPYYDYALWTYSSPEMTFDQCTFNSTGKVINVYCDFIPEGVVRTYTINFNSCTVNNSSSFIFPGKQVLNINDSYPAGQHYVINITGDNIITGSNILPPDSITCSRLFGFAGNTGHNAGNTIVNIEGKTVWKDGKRTVDHNGNDFTTGSYNNSTGSGSANQYTEGYKDNKFKIINTTGWTLKADTTNTYVRTITKQCQYCYEKIDEQEEKAGYCLRYDLNGGTGAEGTYNDTYYPPKDGNTATVAADPSRTGYVFAGWQDANGKLYAAGDTVTVDRDITLTAQWNKLVTVSFDLCGHGGANISSQTFVSGNKASEPTAPKEDGWVFGGWYTEKGCKYRFSFDSAVTSDIILYAKWDRVTTVVSAPVATPTPSPAAAATKTATVKNAAIPQTSDAFPMEGLLALLAVGAVGFGAAGWLRKKHH